MSYEELRKLLAGKDKASRKALNRLATELEETDPELCAELLKPDSQREEVVKAVKAYKFSRVINRIAMVLAVLVVIATYLVSDFGMGLLEGLWNRYCMAMGIIVAMGFFAGGSLLCYRRKEELLATAYLDYSPEEGQDQIEN